MTTNSTTAAKRRKASPGKPNKPYEDFPLFPHATGRWAKKIRGKLHYFGYWRDRPADGWKPALELYQQQRDDLHAGRMPRASTDGVTIRDLCNRFLTSKQHQVDTGEITIRTFRDYNSTTDRIVRVFGKSRVVVDLAADDFESLRADIAKTRGAVALGNEVQRVRVVFKYAYDASLIDKPIRYGPTFKRPSKKTLRLDRNRKQQQNGKKMFPAAELRQIIDAADQPLQAMVLLGINCGFGNSDCGQLPRQALDLDGGWADYPRPKTGIVRRCPLWPETVQALREAIARRPEPSDSANDDLVFITKYGKSWAKETQDNPVSKETKKLIDSIDRDSAKQAKERGIKAPPKVYRKGVGFYALRHTFETIGGETRDQVAVDHIMGHAGEDMASLYREDISDERLRAVVDHVHKWLFG